MNPEHEAIAHRAAWFVAGRMGDRVDYEDLAQAARIAIWRALPKWNGEGILKNYLASCAHFAAMRCYRDFSGWNTRSHRWQWVDQLSDETAAHDEDRDYIIDFHRAFATLSEREQAALLCRIDNGCPDSALERYAASEGVSSQYLGRLGKQGEAKLREALAA